MDSRELAETTDWAAKMNELSRQLDAGEITSEEFVEATKSEEKDERR